MTLPKKIEQGRAEYAYKCAEDGSKKDFKSEYKSYVKKIPMLIKTNGLGATMAFVFSKSKGKEDNAYGLIYKQTAEWIKERTIVKDFEQKKLAKELTEINSSEYRAVTNEILALFTWLRRFAEGLITKD